MLALVAEEHLDAGHRDSGLELVDDDLRFRIRDATGATVGERAVGAEGGEVAAGGDVADPELEVETGGGERAAPELELLGVVAEQAQVSGTRAWRDAGTDRLEHPRSAFADELVEVRRGRFFELGAVVGVGVATQTVHHDEEDLGVGGLDQRREVHARNATGRSSAADPWKGAGRRATLRFRRNDSSRRTRRIVHRFVPTDR